MKLWRIWAKALGEKASLDTQEADRVAMIRTLIVGVNFITCFFIMANTIRHWQGRWVHPCAHQGCINLKRTVAALMEVSFLPLPLVLPTVAAGVARLSRD